MARRTATRPPAITPLRLHDLEPAAAEDLDAHQLHEALSLHDVDLSGRDLEGATLTECELVGVAAASARLQHARILETRLERWDAPVLDASRSTWREVELLGSRLGALDLYDAKIRSTRIVGSRIGWFNLRGSTLEDVVLEDCTLEELDLSGATATRVRLRGCRVDSLLLAGARLADVDLRGLEVGGIANLEALAGATLDAEQVAALAPAFASHLGIRVEG